MLIFLLQVTFKKYPPFATSQSPYTISYKIIYANNRHIIQLIIFLLRTCNLDIYKPNYETIALEIYY